MASFTDDWFSNNIPNWEKMLAEFKDEPITAVELGSWEGRSACWLLDNILTDPDARLFCVDTWGGGEEHADRDMYQVYKRFVNNMEERKDFHKVRIHKCTTTDFFLRELGQFEADLIYIDASHQAKDVLSDAVLAHHMLAPGGIMIFDDYLWGGLGKAPNVPKPAIDAFMECFATEYELLAVGYQVILKRNGEENTKTDSEG